MPQFEVRVAGGTPLPEPEQLAWRLAEVAIDDAEVTNLAATIAADRLIDIVAVATAALARHPVQVARAQAQGRPLTPGSAIFGLPLAKRFAPEWAAWANATAVRELDFHDTFLAAEYAHPADTIAPLLAVAQHTGRDGAALTRAIVAAYEIQVDLARAISLHAHTIDHVAHLAPAIAGGLGALLDLDVATTCQAIGQALHTNTATRQSRKGEISSWKAYAPAFTALTTIVAVDRAMRGERSPSPIYEGEDGVIATLLDGPDAVYSIELPGLGEPKRAIEQTYTKAYSAEYQAQALIDLAIALAAQYPELADPDQVERIEIVTSHHTHKVIGSGSGDRQKYDPDATRETLDHSAPYIVAVALQDRAWHHEQSYAPERAHRPDTVALWQKISTREDAEWTRRYLDPDPAQRAFGGRIEIGFADGRSASAELAVADAHPNGARPFTRADYLAKLADLAGPFAAPGEIERFAHLATRLPELDAREVQGLTIVAWPGRLGEAAARGIW